MIKGVIFDCFGVLCHGSLDYLRSITPPERLNELNDLSHASDYGYVTSEEYAEKVSELINRPSAEIAELTRAQRIISREMVELVRSLKPRYKIALLSNVGRGVMEELFDTKQRSELFDAVVLSSDVGIAKPHPEAYELTAQRLGLLPEECVMIDDLSVNVEGAKNIGMEGIMCQTAAQCAKDLAKLLEEENA
jgi:putative hydrolase of the HAD superfamily